MKSRCIALVLLPFVACNGNPWNVKDRAPGVRAPLSAKCDSADTFRCGLPWPSNVYTVADKTTVTGLRVALQAAALPNNDDPSFLDTGDGFSRVSPVMTGFPLALDPTSLGDLTTGAVRVIRAQPGASGMGEAEPLRLSLIAGDPSAPIGSLVLAEPRRPLLPDADYVAVVLDSLHDMSGVPPPVERETQVALGLVKPDSLTEAQLAAYHAPTRSVLTTAGFDFSHIVRVWDFTTRSLNDPTRRLASMRGVTEAALAAGAITIVLDSVDTTANGSVAAVVEGHFVGVPYFQQSDGALDLDASGLPVASGVHQPPFRVAIPQTTGGTYRVALYGHGTGGDYDDTNFDADITSQGLAKVAGRFIGWTGSDVVNTFAGLDHPCIGSAISTAGLLQSLTDIDVLEHALAGALGDVLAAPALSGQVNPVAGHRPDVRSPVWVGGSLGGTMGLVYSSADPAIELAVLNVPGAAWTQFAALSDFFDPVDTAYAPLFGGQLDLLRLLYTTQGEWDDVDGSSWVDALPPKPERAYLLQESIGDPVLPNLAQEMVANCVGASLVGTPLATIPGIETAGTVEGSSALTQYKVNATAPLDIHGFAAGSTVAGQAARQQIQTFLQTGLAGDPQIVVPPLCTTMGRNGSCDFTNQ